MRKLLFILCVISLPAVASKKPGGFVLLGKVTDVDSGFVLIRNLTKPVADTVLVRKGEFNYSGTLEEATPHVITDEQNRYQMFFAEPEATMHMTLKKNDMQVSFFDGSKSQELFRSLLMAQDPYQKEVEKTKQAMAYPGANRDSLQQVVQQISNRINDNFYEFLKRNGNSEVAAFIVYSSISQNRGVDAVLADSMYSYLNGVGRTSFYGIETGKSVEKLRSVTVGYMAPDFTLPDSTGKKKYSLSGFKGKYVLVDFWASWCGPCKAEIPFIKQAYERFHSKGFDVFSVSLDDKREAWLNGLKQFQMPWPQVSDIKGFRSVVNDLYPIPSIPKTLLLDKTGKIIATDLRGEALDRKLEELLGKD